MRFFVAKLLSIAVMTYTRRSRPTPIRPMNRLIYYALQQRMNFSYAKMHAASARALTRDSIVAHMGPLRG